MKNSSMRYSVGPRATVSIADHDAMARLIQGEAFEFDHLVDAIDAVRRSTALMRASSSRGEKGFVT
jgi:tRNA A37 threonylcarbamoyladenosine dehydratase